MNVEVGTIYGFPPLPAVAKNTQPATSLNIPMETGGKLVSSNVQFIPAVHGLVNDPLARFVIDPTPLGMGYDFPTMFTLKLSPVCVESQILTSSRRKSVER